MGKRMKVEDYPDAEIALWDSEWSCSRVDIGFIVETAAHNHCPVHARRYMPADKMWRPTGERVRVYPDGTCEHVDDGANDGGG